MSIRICRPAPDVPVAVYRRGDPDATRLALSDHRGRWVVLVFYARAFGVLSEGGAAPCATFILDPAGLVRHSLVNDGSAGRNPEETLHALRAGAPCPAG